MRADGHEAPTQSNGMKRTRCHSNGNGNGRGRGSGSHLGCEREPPWSGHAGMLASHRHSPAAAAIVKFCNVTEISVPEKCCFCLCGAFEALPGRVAAAATLAASAKQVRLRCARTATSSDIGRNGDGNRDDGSDVFEVSKGTKWNSLAAHECCAAICWG